MAVAVVEEEMEENVEEEVDEEEEKKHALTVRKHDMKVIQVICTEKKASLLAS